MFAEVKKSKFGMQSSSSIIPYSFSLNQFIAVVTATLQPKLSLLNFFEFYIPNLFYL